MKCISTRSREVIPLIGTLYETFGDEIFYYCLSLTGGESELAADLMQDTFVRAMGNVKVLEGLEAKQRRAWLYKTAKNIFLDKMRRRTFEYGKLPILKGDEFYDHTFDDVELEQILLVLPADLRSLVWMRYIEGYNSTELGEMFQLTPSTVRAKLSAAKKILRAKLLEE